MSEKAVRCDNFGSRSPDHISYWKNERTGHWILHFPKQNFTGSLAAHTVEEHEDGTISASPSILISYGQGNQVHGFLKHGEWSDC